MKNSQMCNIWMYSITDISLLDNLITQWVINLYNTIALIVCLFVSSEVSPNIALYHKKIESSLNLT